MQSALRTPFGTVLGHGCRARFSRRMGRIERYKIAEKAERGISVAPTSRPSVDLYRPAFGIVHSALRQASGDVGRVDKPSGGRSEMHASRFEGGRPFSFLQTTKIKSKTYTPEQALIVCSSLLYFSETPSDPIPPFCTLPLVASSLNFVPPLLHFLF
jgi:hypothetical protein